MSPRSFSLQLPSLRVKDTLYQPCPRNTQRQGPHYPRAGDNRRVTIITRAKAKVSPRREGKCAFRQNDDQLLFPSFQGPRRNRSYRDADFRRQPTGEGYRITD